MWTMLSACALYTNIHTTLFTRIYTFKLNKISNSFCDLLKLNTILYKNTIQNAPWKLTLHEKQNGNAK